MPGTLTRTAAQDRLVALGIAPRGLSLDLAAAYVGLTPGVFLDAIKAGRFPPPQRHGKLGSAKPMRTVWDRDALDQAMDKLSKLEGKAAPLDPADIRQQMQAAISADA
jgi:hypothetical protein